MTRVAFYAPMKSPFDPVPSGDREMARNLMSAIGLNGAAVDLVSDLRIYDKTGHQQVQSQLHQAARVEVNRLLQDLSHDTRLWVTYHNYYKAPDLVGPAVCRALDIPYVQIESTRALSRLNGPWAGFAQAAHDACDAADAIYYLTANDLITLKREKAAHQTLAHLPPFLPSRDLPVASNLTGPMLSVGMMRQGDKLASYHIIAETLCHLTGPWQLDIVGVGPARTEVEQMMAPFGDRVRFLGQLDREALQRIYAQAGLFLWPGVNEAFGMVYLEAQAAGVPVIAQDRPGVRDVVLTPDAPPPKEGPQALATQIMTLLHDPIRRKRLGDIARRGIAQSHLIGATSKLFWATATPLLKDL
jgi:glycosyltransferase involved in cell wall biosynthesis